MRVRVRLGIQRHPKRLQRGMRALKLGKQLRIAPSRPRRRGRRQRERLKRARRGREAEQSVARRNGHLRPSFFAVGALLPCGPRSIGALLSMRRVVRAQLTWGGTKDGSTRRCSASRPALSARAARSCGGAAAATASAAGESGAGGTSSASAAASGSGAVGGCSTGGGIAPARGAQQFVKLYVTTHNFHQSRLSTL